VESGASLVEILSDHLRLHASVPSLSGFLDLVSVNPAYVYYYGVFATIIASYLHNRFRDGCPGCGPLLEYDARLPDPETTRQLRDHLCSFPSLRHLAMFFYYAYLRTIIIGGSHGNLRLRATFTRILIFLNSTLPMPGFPP